MSFSRADLPELTLVVPAFNEVSRLETASARLHAATQSGALDPAATELVVVDDGSTDGTATHFERALAPSFPGLRVLQMGANTGKGAAVRAGVAAATAPVVAFMDADMAVDPEQIPVLVSAVDSAEVVIGSRAVAGASVLRASLRRTFMGRTFNRFVNSLTRLELGDTQCGFKAFNTQAARILFHLMRVERFAFDVEVLHLARQLGMRITEVPVEWSDVAGSRVRPVTDPTTMVLDVLRLRAGRNRPAVPALSISTRARSNGRADVLADADALPDVYDSIDPRLPVLSPAPGHLLVLFPLCDRAEVDLTAGRVADGSSRVTVKERCLSWEQLRHIAPVTTADAIRPAPDRGTVLASAAEVRVGEAEGAPASEPRSPGAERSPFPTHRLALND